MAKNIVILNDGTGNRIKPGKNGAPLGTNVVRLMQMLERNEPGKQVVFYDPGVGTEGSAGSRTGLGRWFTKLVGKAFGLGIKKNVIEAYTFLMNTYETGDKIYLFGFSRGAYTSRAIAGMLRFVGLLPPGSENLVPEAVKLFWRRKLKDPDDYNFSDRWSGALSRTDFDKKSDHAIHFVGVWDTVKAVGWVRKRLVLAWTRKLPNVSNVRHAVSIDERRSQYKANLLSTREVGRDDRDVDEVWFAGVHSDVGGTFHPDHRLADIALHWMVHEALAAGLLVDKSWLDELDAIVTVDSATGELHKMSKLWILLGRTRRPIMPTNARIHQSVKVRMERLDYQPRLPSGHVFVDPSWPERGGPR